MVSSYVLTVPIYTGLSMVQIVLAILFVSLLLVSCILTGIGFYGMYTVSQSAMGIVGLAFGIIGGVSTTIIILIGLFTNPSISFQSYVLNSLYWNWLAFIILGVSFILMGSASIVLREYTMRSTAAYAAGILSIIGGIAFILYILLLTFFVGLALVFVAFLLWAIIFYSTEA
jgi:magnesium-transporting ATPase (P-type)